MFFRIVAAAAGDWIYWWQRVPWTTTTTTCHDARNMEHGRKAHTTLFLLALSSPLGVFFSFPIRPMFLLLLRCCFRLLPVVLLVVVHRVKR
jgi:hypothetical protein